MYQKFTSKRTRKGPELRSSHGLAPTSEQLGDTRPETEDTDDP